MHYSTTIVCYLYLELFRIILSKVLYTIDFEELITNQLLQSYALYTSMLPLAFDRRINIIYLTVT